MRLMRTGVGLILIVTGMLEFGAGTSVAATNLLKNGGFEQPVVGKGSFQLFSLGQTFPGWSVVGASGNVAIISGSFNQNGIQFLSQSGKQWLDLTGVSNSATGVAQTVKTTPGKTYSLSFWVGNVYDPGGIFGVSSTVKVFANGTKVLSATNSIRSTKKKQVWKHFTVNVKAKSSATTLAFINGDPPNDTSNGLDSLQFT